MQYSLYWQLRKWESGTVGKWESGKGFFPVVEEVEGGGVVASRLFEMRRAGGADWHSTELKEFFSRSSVIRVPLNGWTTSQPILKFSLIDGGGEARDARNWDPE
jgi:hypothetical protein